jgi:hypothetical protein
MTSERPLAAVGVIQRRTVPFAQVRQAVGIGKDA